MAVMFGNNGHRVNANLGGGVTVSFDGTHVGVGVNDLRDGVPAFIRLTLDEAAEVHGAIEHFLLTAAPASASASAPTVPKPVNAPKAVVKAPKAVAEPVNAPKAVAEPKAVADPKATLERLIKA